MTFWEEFKKHRIPKIRDPVDDVWTALWRGSISEFFATAIFVFLGTGSVVATQTIIGNTIQIPSLTLIALAHGFAIMIMVYSIGEVSGGHINPAVTWALLLTNKQSFLRAFCYWTAQIFGGIIGSAILRSLTPEVHRHGMGCHGLGIGVSPGQGLWIEVVLTFIFIFVVFATAVSPFVGKISPLSGGENEYGPGKLTPFAVGMTILVLHTVGIPLTGASMNPARSFGPAVVNSCWDNHWIYWLGPLVGSSLAAITAQLIFLSHPASMFKIFEIRRGETPQNLQKNHVALSDQEELQNA